MGGGTTLVRALNRTIAHIARRMPPYIGVDSSSSSIKRNERKSTRIRDNVRFITLPEPVYSLARSASDDHACVCVCVDVIIPPFSQMCKSIVRHCDRRGLS